MEIKILPLLLEIIKESFFIANSFFLKSFKKVRTWLFGSAGALYATKDKLIKDLGDNSFFSLIGNNVYFKIIFFVLIIMCVIFLWFQIKMFFITAWRKWILIKRESVYGNAIIQLSKGYSQIHSNRNKILTVDQVKSILIDFCNCIREIYEFKTKAKCSVSIKTFIDLKDENNGINFDTRVVNLCRDNSCKKRYTNEYETTDHTIANNTCYQKIISKFFSDRHEEMFFLSNDLLSIDDYDNSSFNLFPDFTDEIRKNGELRRMHWPLKYKSEIVVSLSPLEKQESLGFPILGFLCVDCELEKKEVFDSKYDVPLLKGVADGLYDFIKLNLYSK